MEQLKQPKGSTVFGLTPPAKSGVVSSITSTFTEQFRTVGGWNPKKTLYTVSFPIHQWLDEHLVMEVTDIALNYETGVISEHALELTLETVTLGKTSFSLERSFNTTDLLADLNAQSVAYSLTWSYTALVVQNTTRYRFTVANAHATEDCVIGGSFITHGTACHGVLGETTLTAPAADSYLFPALANFLESLFYYVVLSGPTYVNSFGSGGQHCIATIYPEGGGIANALFEVGPPYSIRTGISKEWEMGIVDQFGNPVTSNNFDQPPGIGLNVRQSFTEGRYSR